MNTPSSVSQPNDLRRRLRELLSVPERDRTEEQWDEIVELEIQLAPGNRVGPAGGPPPKSGPTGGGHTGGGYTGGGAAGGGNAAQQPRKHRAKNPGRRPPKPNKPPRDPA